MRSFVFAFLAASSVAADADESAFIQEPWALSPNNEDQLPPWLKMLRSTQGKKGPAPSHLIPGGVGAAVPEDLTLEGDASPDFSEQMQRIDETHDQVRYLREKSSKKQNVENEELEPLIESAKAEIAAIDDIEEEAANLRSEEEASSGVTLSNYRTPAQDKVDWKNIQDTIKAVDLRKPDTVQKVVAAIGGFLEPLPEMQEDVVADTAEAAVLRAQDPDEWFRKELEAHPHRKVLAEIPVTSMVIPVYMPEKTMWKRWAEQILRSQAEGDPKETLPQAVGDVGLELARAVIRPSISALEAVMNSLIYKKAIQQQWDQKVHLARVIDAIYQASGGKHSKIPLHGAAKDLADATIFVGGEKVDWDDVVRELKDYNTPRAYHKHVVNQTMVQLETKGDELERQAAAALKNKVSQLIQAFIAKTQVKKEATA